jgi:predicted RNA binding protein YcfA (HicA-like mRNA interferase family)
MLQIGRLAMVKVRDIIEAVEAAGWVYDHTSGDHRVFKREGVARLVVIPGKPGNDMPEGTLTNVCRQAGINKSMLKRGRR